MWHILTPNVGLEVKAEIKVMNWSNRGLNCTCTRLLTASLLMEHQIVHQGTQSHVTSHPVIWWAENLIETLWASLFVDAWSHLIAGVDSRFTRFDFWTIVYTRIHYSSILVPLKKTLTIRSGIQMQSKDTSEYRLNMSCTIEAGLLNW